MHLPHPHIPFFRIFYSTTFTALSLILAALLLVTPGDHIYESFNKGEIYHIFIVAGLYLLTLLIAVFVYAGRLYATRSALAAIPKEVNWSEEQGRVGREIRKGLATSSTISYESHPRDLRDEKATRGVRKKARLGRPAGGRQSLDSVTSSFKPVWGIISHPGWSSPCSSDLPNLHFEPVVLELSHLIEAKAVSLAPFDPLSSYEPDLNLNREELEAPVPDPVAVELLQRPSSMGLRDYLAQLANLGMLDLEPLASAFLTRYEHARYSGEELDEGEFRALMGVFADILRDMRPLDVAIVDEVRTEMEEAMSDESGSGDEAGSRDAESINTTETVQRTPQPEAYAVSSSSSSSFSSSSNGSRRDSQGTVHMPPSRPIAMRNPSSRSRRSAKNHSVHQPSLSSLRRMRTDTSSSGYSAGSRAGSVIRLKDARGPLDLPYAIMTGDGQEI